MAKKYTYFTDYVPPEKITMIGGFPTPPPRKVRRFHAAMSVMKLLVNKEDTRQVFEIVTALAGKNSQRMFRRFVGSDYGRQVVSQPIRLQELLNRRDYLRSLPEGSLGRIYLNFMESEGLTPNGIIDAAEEAGFDYHSPTQFEEFRQMFIHSEVSHDVWHVLSGYGRDTLGELCLLGFTHAQNRNPGFRLIVFIGAIAAKFEQPSLPIWRAINQGIDIGKKSAWLLEHDLEPLLPMPLEDVRRRLNIAEPTVYNSIPQEIKDRLLKPRVDRTQSERESGKISVASTA